MKTLASLSIVAVLALGALPLAGCMAGASTDASGAAADEKDGPEGSAQSAITATGLTLFEGPFLIGGSMTYTASTMFLDSWDNRANSLVNNTSQAVTVFSGDGYTGRCQVIPPGMTYNDLGSQDIGPGYISSIWFGENCTEGTSDLTMCNNFIDVERFRPIVDGVIGDWGHALYPFIGDCQTFKFSRNAYKIGYTTEDRQFDGSWGGDVTATVKTVDWGLLGNQTP